MTLTTEDLGDIPDVTAASLDAVLASDGFGKFAILAASDQDYIQAANDWQPDEASRAFLQDHDSDPWVLEFREGGRQFRATGHAPLEQVRQAFQSYLAGGPEWRRAFEWQDLRL